MKPILSKILGVIASIATLLIGSFLFIFIFAGVLLGSGSGPTDTFRVVIGWFNIIGTPVLSLTGVTYILKKTWSTKFALRILALMVLSLFVFFMTYIYPRFFLGLGGYQSSSEVSPNRKASL